MTKLVGVHGVGNHYDGLPASQAAGVLSEAWTEALASKLVKARLNLSVAYYADVLNRAATAQGDDDCLDVPHGLALAWARALGAPDEIAQGWLTYPAHQFAQWVARHFGLDLAMVRWFVGRFLREVDTYLNGEERAEAQATVIETIERHEPAVVIAHSLGSVVAYEALHRRPDLKVDLFITVGSPLGMPGVIFERLHPTPAERRRPPGVSKWVNIADVGDLVAVPHPLPPCFGVDADLKDTIGVFAFHRVTKYLASRTVSAAVAAAI